MAPSVAEKTAFLWFDPDHVAESTARTEPCRMKREIFGMVKKNVRPDLLLPKETAGNRRLTIRGHPAILLTLQRQLRALLHSGKTSTTQMPMRGASTERKEFRK